MIRRNFRKGFSIVELVIVLVVVAVLAAVLIPTFSGITRSADETSALADSKISYEEYLADTLPEDIDDELFVQVKKGYVHYLDGSALKTGESYVTKIDEFDQWIDPKGNYHPAFYITIDKLRDLFISDYNVIALSKNVQSLTDIKEYWDDEIKRSVWENEDFYNRWSWMLNFFSDLSVKQGKDNQYIEKFLNEKGTDNNLENGYGYALQNIAVFFLKIDYNTWDAEHKATYGILSSSWTTLDFTAVTFGDYAPFIPYELFNNDRMVARDQLYNQLVSELVLDVQTVKGNSLTLNYFQNLSINATGYNIFTTTEGNTAFLSNEEMRIKWEWLLVTFKDIRTNGNLDVSQYDNVISLGYVTGDAATINMEFIGLITERQMSYNSYKSSNYSNEEIMLKVLAAYYDSKN